MRILGELYRGNSNYIYQIKKIPNFWEFEKNISPPPMLSEIVGDVWGNVGENRVGDCFLNVGEILGEVHIDKFGWGRKF